MLTNAAPPSDEIRRSPARHVDFAAAVSVWQSGAGPRQAAAKWMLCLYEQRRFMKGRQ